LPVAVAVAIRFVARTRFELLHRNVLAAAGRVPSFFDRLLRDCR
jgi:hypothetical protein